MNSLGSRYDTLSHQLVRNGLPRLPFAPRFKDELEVRLQFALKRFAGHTYGRNVNPSSEITSYQRSHRVNLRQVLKCGDNR